MWQLGVICVEVPSDSLQHLVVVINTLCYLCNLFCTFELYIILLVVILSSTVVYTGFASERTNDAFIAVCDAAYMCAARRRKYRVHTCGGWRVNQKIDICSIWQITVHVTIDLLMVLINITSVQ